MAALTNNNLNGVPILDAVNKTIKWKDLLDYTTFGLTLPQVVGCYTATQDQTGDEFYNNVNFNVPDVVVNTSLISTPAQDYPLDPVTLAMLTGNMTIEYRVRVAFTAIPIASVEGAPANVFNVPIVLFGDYVPIIGMTIVTTGNSNAANNGTFVITGVETGGGEYTLQVAEALVAEAGTPGAEMAVYFTFSKEFEFCFKLFTIPTVKQNNYYSCLTGTLVANDVTAVGAPTIDVPVHTVAYPQALGDQQPADIVSSELTILVGPPIYTMTWTITAQRTLEYTMTDGLIVACVISGVDEPIVACFNLCCLVESLGLLKAKMDAEVASAGTSQYTTDYLKGVGLFVLIRENAERCDNTTKAEVYVAELKKLLAKYSCLCDDCADCTGTSTTPQAIYPASLTVIGASAVSLTPITGLDATNLQTAIAALFAGIQYTLKAGLPGLTDDINAGVAQYAIKQNTISGILYRCTSNAAGAATWEVFYDPNATITLPYIDYVGRLTSSGVLISEAEVLNDFGSPIVWARTSAGNYTGTLAGAFADELTEVFVKNNRISAASFMSGVRVDDDTVLVTTRDNTGALSDGLLNETFVEIRKYAS